MYMDKVAKRGQAAAGAAVLVAIIAGLIIMFIILIPPQDRAELLGEDSLIVDDDLDDTTSAKKLLTVTPGRLDFLAQKEIEHPLPVITVFTTTESKIIAQKNIAQAKKGVFSEEVSEFRFTIPDVANTGDVLLSFNVKNVEGRLVVTLNGEKIFNQEVLPGPIAPIMISQNSLQEDNLVTFSASSPGLTFWQTNEVSLENVKIIADVTSLAAQSSKNVFLVSETEKQNLDKVVLRFKPDCELTEVGKLSIAVNGREIYNAVPDCDVSIIPIEFSPEIVNQGENDVTFQTAEGTYQLSHVLIRSELREVDFPTYYFDLSEEEYVNVQSDNQKVRLRVNFVDVVTLKTGEVVFNGHRTRFDTKEVDFTLDLSDNVVRGNNAIKIKPKKTLEIRELRVDLVN